MQPRSTAAPDDIQMSTVFEALKRRAPWLILASAVIGAATFAILSMMAPRYLSEAELAIVAQGSANAFADTRSPSASPDLVTTRMDKEAINTHVKAMQSPELLEQIAAKLHLKDRPEFNSELGPVDTLGSNSSSRRHRRSEKRGKRTRSRDVGISQPASGLFGEGEPVHRCSRDVHRSRNSRPILRTALPKIIARLSQSRALSKSTISRTFCEAKIEQADTGGRGRRD